MFLRFSNYANDTIRGFEVAHSYYSSKTLARNLTYGVHKNLKMPLSPMYTGSDAGIVTGLLAEGADGKTIYDTNLYLREVVEEQHWQGNTQKQVKNKMLIL